MVTTQLLDYVRQQFSSGVAKEDIRNMLLSNSWSAQDADEALATIGDVPPAVPSPDAPFQISVQSTPAVVEPTTGPGVVLEEMTVMPRNVWYFMILVYISIIIGAAAFFFSLGDYQYRRVPFVGIIFILVFFGVKAVFIYLTVRRKMNWARILLVVFFFMGLSRLITIVELLSSHPFLALVSLTSILLEGAAFGFLFSPSANRWFDSGGSVGKSLSGIDGENATWSRVIPRINKGFMIASLVLVFGLDLVILISGPELAPFYFIMLAVLAIFGVFYYRENYVLNKRFANSRSALDTWMTTLIVIRNCVFLLNFIPFIQIAGGMTLVFGGVPYLIAYVIIDTKRSKLAQQVG